MDPPISTREPQKRNRHNRSPDRRGTLGSDELRRMDAYWRAANYLSVGQIYLYDNPLLREPLKLSHVKPLVVGHWGTTPGQNFIYVHLNRLIKKYDLDMFYIAGPGHGGPALDNVSFSGCWGYDEYWYGSFSPDEELRNALAASSKACPELCAAIQREIAKRGAILLGGVDYETIFQSIIRRHPSLWHISIEECVRNPTSDYYDKTFTLITATEIEFDQYSVRQYSQKWTA